jgi:hypothetical protein
LLEGKAVSVAQTLTEIQASGICLHSDGVGLFIDAERKPPQEMIDALRRNKSEILDLLQTHRTNQISPVPTVSQAPGLHRFTLVELEVAACEDLPEVRSAPAML